MALEKEVETVWPTWFDRFFPSRLLPELFIDLVPRMSMIRVEEYLEDGALVVKAELPGLDPDKDIEISVHDGKLDIAAERREVERTEGRSEFRYGTLRRQLALPVGVTEKDITATYTDGILEVRMPMPKPAAGTVTKIPVGR